MALSFVCSQHKFQWRKKDKTGMNPGLSNSGIIHLWIGLKSLAGFNHIIEITDLSSGTWIMTISLVITTWFPWKYLDIVCRKSLILCARTDRLCQSHRSLTPSPGGSRWLSCPWGPCSSRASWDPPPPPALSGCPGCPGSIPSILLVSNLDQSGASSHLTVQGPHDHGSSVQRPLGVRLWKHPHWMWIQHLLCLPWPFFI